jgi:eukaryotic-like serine/threonine-protein kinase
VTDDSPTEALTRADDGVRDSVVIGPYLGPYRLLQRVGEGGMGEVWLAEQSAPVRRQVAIKIVKAGMDTAHVVARFEAERQALALMDHPAIAKVFDAGATPEGRPYFAMEYVRGEMITQYCSRHRLSTRDRLSLFLLVCDGVQHAHQRAIIHRDLKPSNILVALLDDQPVPKVIDFGLAKALVQPLTDHTLHTEIGAFIGTPEYMSPEQAEMSALDIDTRTDVYALGVVLYELLTGTLPFDSKALRDKGLDEIRRTIREVDPPRPSTRVSNAGPGATRSIDGDRVRLVRELRGDLDWITMRALEKDRERRYGSVSDLAADVRRHLGNLPVTASPPSTLYRTRKFVRRHRVGVGVTATIAVLLIIFAVTTAMQARRIALERDRANQEASIARAVNEFLQSDLLAQASANAQARPDTKPDPDLTVRTALDRAAAQVAGRFEKQPIIEASIRYTIGRTYVDLGLYPEAAAQFQRTVELRRGVLGEDHRDTLMAMNDLGDVYSSLQKFKEAESLLTQVLGAGRRVVGEEDRLTTNTLNNLALAYSRQGKTQQAEPLYIRSLELSRRVLGTEHLDTVTTLNNLAMLYFRQRRYAEAEPRLVEALAVWRRVLGEEHPYTMTVKNNLAMLYDDTGAYPKADPLHHEVTEFATRVLGAEHTNTILSLCNLANHYRLQGKYAEAEAQLTKATTSIQKVPEGENRDSLVSTIENRLVEVYSDSGKYAEAGAVVERRLNSARKTLGEEHLTTAANRITLGRIRILERKYVEAESMLRLAVATYAKASPNVWNRYNSERLLGMALGAQRKHSEAEQRLRSGYDGMTAILQRDSTAPTASRRLAMEETRQSLAALYTTWGKPEEAAKWRDRAAPADAR